MCARHHFEHPVESLVGLSLAQYRFSEHGNLYTVPSHDSRLLVIGGHVHAYVALGDHANYEACYSSPIAIRGIQGLVASDATPCATTAEKFLTGYSGAFGNLGSYTLARRFACWQGLFGNQDGGSGLIGQFFGTSPEAPLRQAGDPAATAACANAERTY